MHLLLLSQSAQEEKSQNPLGAFFNGKKNKRQSHPGEDLPEVLQGLPPPLILVTVVCSPIWVQLHSWVTFTHVEVTPSPSIPLQSPFWHRMPWARAPPWHWSAGKQIALNSRRPFTYFSYSQYTSRRCFVTLIPALAALWDPNQDQQGPNSRGTWQLGEITQGQSPAGLLPPSCPTKTKAHL